LNNDSKKSLIDKKVLLIVKKIQRDDRLSDDVVEVIRITDDRELINQFHLNDSNFTPAKVLKFDWNLSSAKILFDECVS
jgi:hypothetical protein